jgi:hypothetical protein
MEEAPDPQWKKKNGRGEAQEPRRRTSKEKVDWLMPYSNTTFRV